jgi:hypothetical protein
MGIGSSKLSNSKTFSLDNTNLMNHVSLNSFLYLPVYLDYVFDLGYTVGSRAFSHKL